MEIISLSNYTCVYTTDFQSHRKSNVYISHLNYLQLYETLHLETAAHFQKVTEKGPSLKQVLPSKHAYMGPIWATHMGYPYGTHMGSATGFGMGPIWVSPYAGCPDGSHMGPI